jgi:tRNA pseudouridine38-40 synthase
VTLFDPTGEIARLKLVVAYDGSGFRGFARQPDQRTIAGELETALTKIARAPVEITGAGRTDAGVHAWGQVVSCDAPADLDLRRVRNSLNSMLNPHIAIRSVEYVASDFDARFSARWRSYRYTIVNRSLIDPFRATTAWWVEHPLDLHRLMLGADVFIGEHDFASFCRRGPEGSTTTRRVYESQWVDEGDGILRYEIRASAFCWQMVRSIVGTLVDVGLGRTKPGELRGILAARDRSAAGQVAPPHGLSLWEVGYATMSEGSSKID